MTTIRWERSDSERPAGTRSRPSSGLRGAGGQRDGERGRCSGDERSDGGADDNCEDDETFTTYANDEYGYRVAYPAGWSVEAEPPGGASFGASGASDVGKASDIGAVVFVDEGIDTPEGYVEVFVDDLRADEHVHAFEPAIRRDVRLASGQPGQVIECPYVGETPEETWRLMYLFAVVDTIGYTVGVDWNDDEAFGAVAARIVGSFAVEADERTDDDHGET